MFIRKALNTSKIFLKLCFLSFIYHLTGSNKNKVFALYISQLLNIIE